MLRLVRDEYYYLLYWLCLASLPPNFAHQHSLLQQQQQAAFAAGLVRYRNVGHEINVQLPGHGLLPQQAFSQLLSSASQPPMPSLDPATLAMLPPQLQAMHAARLQAAIAQRQAIEVANTRREDYGAKVSLFIRNLMINNILARRQMVCNACKNCVEHIKKEIW